MLTLPIMQKMWPSGNQHIPGLLEGIAASAPAVFEKYSITTPLTIALMFGQFSEECGAGLEMQENMNYTAQRLLQVFPAHFTATLAAKAAHNPEMIAEIAYGGRMGNAPPPSTDGWIYRGQGISQCTGKGVHTPPEPDEGYAALGNKTGLPLVDQPQLIITPAHALECGVGDFVLCGCLPFAEAGDILNTTKRLNGGTNGLASREQWTAQWKRELGL